MRKHRTALLVVGLLAATSVPLAATPAPSEGFAFSTYREQVDGVIVFVDSFPASLHDRDAFVPLHVAIGLEGHHDPVTITIESFTLVDREGNTYPLAAYPQIKREYGKTAFDWSLIRARPLVVGSQFVASEELAASFFPTVGLVKDIVHMANFTWFHDLLYFPHPRAGLGGVLELRVSGKGIEQPVAVRFQVPLRMREEADGP